METLKKRILVVDDDQDLLFQMSHVLKTHGYEVIEASGEEDAIKKANSITPDLAIVDLMMERKDSGFILTHKLKKKYPSLPVIMVSALTHDTGMIFDLSDPSNKSWIKADSFIDKNIRADQLLREVRKFLEL